MICQDVDLLFPLRPHHSGTVRIERLNLRRDEIDREQSEKSSERHFKLLQILHLDSKAPRPNLMKQTASRVQQTWNQKVRTTFRSATMRHRHDIPLPRFGHLRLTISRAISARVRWSCLSKRDISPTRFLVPCSRRASYSDLFPISDTPCPQHCVCYS